MLTLPSFIFRCLVTWIRDPNVPHTFFVDLNEMLPEIQGQLHSLFFPFLPGRQDAASQLLYMVYTGIRG